MSLQDVIDSDSKCTHQLHICAIPNFDIQHLLAFADNDTHMAYLDGTGLPHCLDNKH